jgi:hypothetical protein
MYLGLYRRVLQYILFGHLNTPDMILDQYLNSLPDFHTFQVLGKKWTIDNPVRICRFADNEIHWWPSKCPHENSQCIDLLKLFGLFFCLKLTCFGIKFSSLLTMLVLSIKTKLTLLNLLSGLLQHLLIFCIHAQKLSNDLFELLNRAKVPNQNPYKEGDLI